MSYPGPRGSMIKPEDAILRANEFVKQGQTKFAIQKLQDVFKSRRPRSWNEKHEDAMLKLVELSIKERRPLKDDLMSYRQFARDVQQPTVERVLFAVVAKAEERTAEAEERKEERATEVCEAEDITDESPESILMKAVSPNEEVKDRISRELVHPWLRYLTDCFKACLDVCMKHPDYDDTFHKLASRAFAFCKRRNQKAAFRNNFCRLVRDHWTAMSAISKDRREKMKEQVKMEQDPKTGEPTRWDTKFNLMIQAHLDQLDAAVFFDNWQDAYKAIEEIHAKMTHFKVTPSMDTMVTYYNMLAQIFWVSNNYLFHSFALQRIFRNKEAEVIDKKKDQQKEAQERQLLASKVVLSVLCIPYWKQDRITPVTPFTPDIQREKAERMTRLLKSQGAPPTRETLLAEVNNNQALLRLAHPEVVELYNVIERNVQPLTMAEKVEPLLKWLEANNLDIYVKQLKEVAATSVVISSSRVYSTLSLSALRGMCRFYENMDLESLLVSVARAPNSNVGLCIDHQSSSVRFTDANASQDILTAALPNMRERLALVNRKLVKEDEAVRNEQLIETQRCLLLKRVQKMRDAERASIAQRTDIIEKMKKKAEEDARAAMKQKEDQAKEDKQRQLDEQKRKVEEDRKRRMEQEKEEERKVKEAERNQMMIEQMENLKNTKMRHLKEKVKAGGMNHDDIVQAGTQLILKAQQKEDAKRLKEWHAVHWLERAAREAEAPLIREQHESHLEAQKNAYETRKRNTVEQMEKDWQEKHANKVRLSRMVDYMDEFRERVIQLRLKDEGLRQQAIEHVRSVIDEEETMRVNRGDSLAVHEQRVGSVPAKEEAKPSEALAASNWRMGSTSSTGASPQAEAAAPAAAPASGAASKAWRPAHKRNEEPAAPAAAPAPAAAASAGADSLRTKSETEKPAEPEKKAWKPKRGGFQTSM